MLRRVFAGLLLLSTVSLASAQWAPIGNPIVDAAIQLGSTGIKPASKPSKVTTSFTPSGESKAYIDKVIDEIFSTKEEREGYRPVFDKVFANYPATMKPAGLDNDAAAAFAFTVTTILTVQKKVEFDDTTFAKVAAEFQAALAPSASKATNAQKEEAYNFALSSACAYLSYASSTSDEAKLRPLGEALLISLVGAKSDDIEIDKSGISIKAKQKATVPASNGKLAVTFSLPDGWRKDDKSPWYVSEYRDPRYGNNADTTAANVRFLPAIPAGGSFSDALRAAWKQAVPAEFADKASNLTYRKLIGDGLVSQFVYSVGNEKGKTWPTLFAVYLIDCGATWQPVVVAHVWIPVDKFPIGGEMMAQYSFPRSADMIEAFLKTIRCEGMKPRNVIDKDALVGAFNFGNSASMDYVNIYTGATVATNFVSYGGTLTLHKDGTFDYLYSSASGQVGNAKFGKIVGKGTWSINGDILTTKYSLYDQGDAYHREMDQYRIGAVVTFSDGEKGCILMDIKKPVNPCTVTAKEEFYTTKKK